MTNIHYNIITGSQEARDIAMNIKRMNGLNKTWNDD